MPEQSNIKYFFQNQTIFLTGGTGFVGKVVIEKILRDCWDVKKIYLLTRPKKNKTPKERFDQLFNLPCFDLIRHKNLQTKVCLISGDCNKPFLGLNDQDLTILKEETTVFIHAAAYVKFDQTLKQISQGIKTAQDVIALAKSMPMLKVFLYISTAYSNCINKFIKEDFYKAPVKAETFVEFVDSFDEEIHQKVTPILLDRWPNTYVFGKCMIEDLIKRSNIGVPTAIVRPGIIISAIDEPFPGWIDNLYGLIGITVGLGLGAIHTVHVNPDNVLSLVPVDHVSNNILAVAWYTNEKKSKEIDIYNCVGFELENSPFTINNLQKTTDPMYYEFPADQTIWYMFVVFTPQKWLYKILVFLWHTIPAYLADFVLLALRKKPIAVKSYEKVQKGLDLIAYFACDEWIFEQRNMKELWQKMNENDRKIFNFSLKELNFKNYAWNTIFGLRKYLLKNPEETLPTAKRRLKILIVVHYLFVSFLLYLFYKVLISFIGRLVME